MKLGCIADDFTGATDLANNLVRAGMRTVQTIGVPGEGEAPVDADGVVVALKSRTTPPGEAVAQSLAACRWLRAAGATQIYFKVCSTFDSTPRGNIGPVLEALMDELDCRFTIATPAFPDNGRTVFKGYLFVGDVLLSESGMRHHPLTPMTDPNLVRVLQAQLATTSGTGRAPRRVGLVEHGATSSSPEAIADRLRALSGQGLSIAIADAVDNEDLLRLAVAVKDMPLVCAGSGLAIGLPANFGLVPSREAVWPPTVTCSASRRRRSRRSRAAAPSSRAAARRRRTRRSPRSSAPAARRGASIRFHLPRRATMPSSPTSRAGPRRSGPRRRTVRCSSTALRRPGPWPRRSRAWAPPPQARGLNRCSLPWRAVSSSSARADSSSPAARPRARP